MRAKILIGLGTAAVTLAVIRRRRRSYPPPVPYSQAGTKILILGGGFGGLYTALSLGQRLQGNRDVSILLLDRNDFFTFWPMVPEVISGSIDILHLLRPLRGRLLQKGVQFIRAGVEDVDLENHIVHTSAGPIPFDKLVIALGWKTAFFSTPGAAEHALQLESIKDAVQIRNRVIECFEEAAAAHLEETSPDKVKLGFVVVGGGSSGVEAAANISGLISTLLPQYPFLDHNNVRLSIVQAHGDVLPQMEPALRHTAAGRLKDERVEVVTGTKVTAVHKDGVTLQDGRRIPANSVVWAAGVEPNPITRKIYRATPDHKGRLQTDEYLRLEGRSGVYTLGDIAAVSSEGQPVPPTAQAATQEAECAAHNLAAEILGRPLKPFKYEYLGQLVELGGKFAVSQVMGVRLSGMVAQLLWRGVYLYKLGDNKDRVKVVGDWILDLAWEPEAVRIPLGE